MSFRTRLCATLLAIFTLLAAPAAQATGASAPPRGKVFLTVDEALALAFPKCEVVRGQTTLTKKERERAQKLAGEDVRSRLAFPYTATKDGRVVGTAAEMQCAPRWPPS
jgi:hypothetical protein